MMNNSVGSKLWSVYEDLKNDRKIGFLTDEEFQRYFLGFVSYKFLSENLELYINEKLKNDNLDFEEAYKYDDYKDLLRDQSVNELGYFLRPNLLFKNIVSPMNYGTIIIKELDKAFKEISDSSINTESQEDFQNLFEGVDLKASQLGKRLEDKNRVVFNILDALSHVDFLLEKQNSKFKQGTSLALGGSQINKPDVPPVSANELLKNALAENLIEANYNFEKVSFLKESLAEEKMNMEADYMNISEKVSAVDSDSKYARRELSSIKNSGLRSHRHYGSFEDLSSEYDENENSETPSVGEAFEYLLNKFSLISKKGFDFYTPNDVSRLISGLVKSEKNKIGSVYDPCCGSASLLLQLDKEMDCDMIYGQEINASTYNIARQNLIVHNIPYKEFDIKQGDTLEQPQHSDQFDVIVSQLALNSKWSADKHFLEDPRFRQFKILAPGNKAEYAFIQHMLYHLKEDGIMVIVVPHGVLFRAAAERRIRKSIIVDFNCLDAVIGLPANMFYSTNIPSCIMIFKKNRKYEENILFIDASKEFGKSKLRNNLRDEDIQKIVNTYEHRLEIERYSHNASWEELYDNDYNLNIARYVDTFEGEEIIDKDYLIERHKFVSNEIKEITNEIKNCYDELNLKNNLFR